MARINRRIKAAQARKGLSVPEIAALPGRPAKFGAKTIGRVIRGERALEPHEAEWLAEVLDVAPAYFFEEDPPAEDPTVGDRFAALEQRVLEQLARHAARVEEMLERQDRVLSRIEARLSDDRGVRDEIAELIRDRGREIVEGHAADAPDPQPTPPPTADAATTPGVPQRTP